MTTTVALVILVRKEVDSHHPCSLRSMVPRLYRF
jgi:hypothetical protein